jgi:hypothetical protein
LIDALLNCTIEDVVQECEIVVPMSHLQGVHGAQTIHFELSRAMSFKGYVAISKQALLASSATTTLHSRSRSAFAWQSL